MRPVRGCALIYKQNTRDQLTQLRKQRPAIGCAQTINSNTMVAHGIPEVPPAALAISSTTDGDYIESTATTVVDTVLTIAKEASETFKNVPYIKAFAGIVIQIIRIREVRELSGELNGLTRIPPAGNSNGEGTISRTHR